MPARFLPFKAVVEILKGFAASGEDNYTVWDAIQQVGTGSIGFMTRALTTCPNHAALI